VLPLTAAAPNCVDEPEHIVTGLPAIAAGADDGSMVIVTGVLPDDLQYGLFSNCVSA
jgi:hypothetical protein